MKWVLQKFTFSFSTVSSWCFLRYVTVPSWCFLRDGTVPSWCFLCDSTVPSQCFLCDSTVPSLCFLCDGNDYNHYRKIYLNREYPKRKPFSFVISKNKL